MTIQTIPAPTVSKPIHPERISVSLDEFGIEEVAEYLRVNGYQVDGSFSAAILEAARSQRGSYCARCHDDDDAEQGLLITDYQLARVTTLAVCGQHDSAREFVLQIVSDYIGRKL